MKKKSRLESTCEAETRLEEEGSVRDYVRTARKRFTAKKKRALEIRFDLHGSDLLEIRFDL